MRRIMQQVYGICKSRHFSKSKERKNQPVTAAGSLRKVQDQNPLKSAAQRILSSAFLNRRAKKASLTVEAAAAAPLFLLAMAMLLSAIELYRMEALLTVSAQESAMRAGMYAYVSGESGEEGGGAALVPGAAATAIGNLNIPEAVRENGEVSLLGSSSGGTAVDLQITYEMPVWFSFFPVSGLRCANRGYVYPWTGWDKSLAGDGGAGASGGDTMVYVAENGSVYHTSDDCTHIHLTIFQTTEEQVGKLRNDSGGKYRACEKCAGDPGGGILYVSPSGDKYHTSPSCSGLKRTVTLVKKSELSGMKQCERCAAKQAG